MRITARASEANREAELGVGLGTGFGAELGVHIYYNLTLPAHCL